MLEKNNNVIINYTTKLDFIKKTVGNLYKGELLRYYGNGMRYSKNELRKNNKITTFLRNIIMYKNLLQSDLSHKQFVIQYNENLKNKKHKISDKTIQFAKKGILGFRKLNFESRLTKQEELEIIEEILSKNIINKY